MLYYYKFNTKTHRRRTEMPNRTNTKNGHAAIAQYLSEAQISRLLQYVKRKADWARQKGTNRAIVDELVILLLADTGLRPRELCNLNIADLPTSHDRNTVWVRDAQGNVTRDIELTSRTAKSLERFVRLYRKGAGPNEPLLISERGKRIIYMSLYSKVKNIGEKAKIGRLNPRMLRQSYMVRLYKREHDLRLVQTQAGHARPATTAIYVKANNKGLKQNDKALKDARFSGVDYMGASANKSATAQSSLPEATGLGAHDSLKGSRQIETCEACCRSIPAADGTRIDSGQILCADCLKEFRRR
jgi:integrase